MSTGLLEGKKGLVFGVANDKSIAWGCAKTCAAQGAEMIFSYPSDSLKKRVEKLVDAELGGAPTLPCDVSSDEQIAAFFEEVRKQWDSVDFLIHSVAYAEREDLKNPFVDTPRSHFAMALDISAYSLAALSREVAPMMTAGGSIVAMTYYGAEKVIPNYNVMGVAKAALEASCRYLAADLGPQGIRVNCISAGPIRTLSASAISGVRSMLDLTEKVTPLRRNVTQDEVGQTTMYLLSDAASAITGETLHVDCGYNILGMYEDLPE